jgi:hypothetical protein
MVLFLNNEHTWAYLVVGAEELDDVEGELVGAGKLCRELLTDLVHRGG